MNIVAVHDPTHFTTKSFRTMNRLLRLVALWEPDKIVIDGQRHSDQPEILTATIIRHSIDKAHRIAFTVRHPFASHPYNVSVTVTDATIAEKKAALGHHIVTSLHAAYEQALAPLMMESAPPHSTARIR